MSVIGALAHTAAPIAGGALLGLSVGKSKPSIPDVRVGIIGELELLEHIPEEQADRRAALKRTIEQQIDDLVVAIERRRALQRRTRFFTEKANWRDLLLFVSAVLFVAIVWDFEHHTWHWLPMLIASISISVITGVFALRGFLTSFRAAAATSKTASTPEDHPLPPPSP